MMVNSFEKMFNSFWSFPPKQDSQGRSKHRFQHPLVYSHRSIVLKIIKQRFHNMKEEMKQTSKCQYPSQKKAQPKVYTHPGNPGTV